MNIYGNKGSHLHSAGGVMSPTYRSWGNMIARCTYRSNPAFAYYKKRGITVCKRWRLFANFLADMGVRPEGNYTIERIDNNGNYEPNNCRWATRREQANNLITNLRFLYEDRWFTLSDLARFSGVSKEILRCRLCRSKLPWTVEGAIKTPKLPKKMSRASFYC